MSGSSPIFVKTYDLLVWLEQALAKFPKEQRFRLAAHIEESLMRFYDLILHAARTQQNRRYLLQEADLELERLRMLIRAAKDTQTMSFQHYQTASEKVNEVGKILGSWLNKLKEATPAEPSAVCGEEPPAGRVLEQQS
jgi:hypothetical protein